MLGGLAGLDWYSFSLPQQSDVILRATEGREVPAASDSDLELASDIQF